MSQQQITPSCDFDFSLDFSSAEGAENLEMQWPMTPTKEFLPQHGTFGVFAIDENGAGDFSECLFDGEALLDNPDDLETWLQSPSTESLDSIISQMTGFQEGLGQFDTSVGVDNSQGLSWDEYQQGDLGQFIGVVPNNPQVLSREGSPQENFMDGHAAPTQFYECWPQQTSSYQVLDMPPAPALYPVSAFDGFLDPQQGPVEEYILPHFEHGANEGYRLVSLEPGANEGHAPVRLEQEEAQPTITPPQQASQPDAQRMKPHGLAFGNLAQAEAAMSQRQIEKNWRAPENDDTIPATDNERAAYVFDLLEAMKDTSKCEDRSKNPAFQNRWVAGAPYEPLPDQMEKVCWKIVDVAEKLHLYGPASLSIYDPQAMTLVFKSRLLTFKERIDHTCQLMRLSKARCFHMLKGESIETTVGSPVQRINGTKVNNDQNGKRQKIMEEGRPLWKKKNGVGAVSQTPPPDNEEDNVNDPVGHVDVGIVPAVDAVGHSPHPNMEYGAPLRAPQQAPHNLQTNQVVESRNWVSGTNLYQPNHVQTGHAQPSTNLSHALSNLAPGYGFQQQSVPYSEPLYYPVQPMQIQQPVLQPSPYDIGPRSSSKKRTADDAQMDAETSHPARRIRYARPRRVSNQHRLVNPRDSTNIS